MDGYEETVTHTETELGGEIDTKAGTHARRTEPPIPTPWRHVPEGRGTSSREKRQEIHRETGREMRHISETLKTLRDRDTEETGSHTPSKRCVCRGKDADPARERGTRGCRFRHTPDPERQSPRERCT